MSVSDPLDDLICGMQRGPSRPIRYRRQILFDDHNSTVISQMS